jgi:hypothetical protein
MNSIKPKKIGSNSRLLGARTNGVSIKSPAMGKKQIMNSGTTEPHSVGHSN